MFRKAIYFFLVCLSVSSVFLGIDPARSEETKQEELYKKALSLKNDGDSDSAVEILSKLLAENPAVGKYEIGHLDTVIDQCITMKGLNNSAWKVKAKEMGNKIKLIQARESTNADYWLVYAKYSWLVETRRDKHITKALEKALFYKPGYAEAYILKGDIYFDLAKKADPNEKQDDNSFTGGSGISDRHSQALTARSSYEAALLSSNMDNKRKAYIYNKMGDLKYQIFSDTAAAKKDWERAASLSPDSRAGKLAGEKLKQ